jgi:hypothetical protein
LSVFDSIVIIDMFEAVFWALRSAIWSGVGGEVKEVKKKRGINKGVEEEEEKKTNETKKKTKKTEETKNKTKRMNWRMKRKNLEEEKRKRRFSIGRWSTK